MEISHIIYQSYVRKGKGSALWRLGLVECVPIGVHELGVYPTNVQAVGPLRGWAS